MGKDIGISTGFDELDSLTSGFHNSELTILGYRSSLDGYSLALSMASHIALKNNIPTTFFTIKIDDEELKKPLLSSENVLLYFFHRWPTTLTHIKTQICFVHAEYKTDVVFIDISLAVFRVDESVPINEHFKEISKELKNISRELDIPIVVLINFTNPSVILDASFFEKEADVIMILEREKEGNEAKLRVVQQCNGKTGTVNLVFVPEYARYENM